VSNTVFEAIIDRTGTAVSEGRSLAYSLKQSGEFPPIVIHMVAVGEKTGELENMLNSVADNFELQVENKLGSITSLLQPTMMIGMFLIVGFIVVSVLLPILEMNDVVK
jgi:general secretion pathway protein F